MVCNRIRRGQWNYGNRPCSLVPLMRIAYFEPAAMAGHEGARGTCWASWILKKVRRELSSIGLLLHQLGINMICINEEIFL